MSRGHKSAAQDFNAMADSLQRAQNQQRQLMNWGVRADVSTTVGHHNIKYGVDLKQTRLLENFGFGITDPTFNSPRRWEG